MVPFLNHLFPSLRTYSAEWRETVLCMSLFVYPCFMCNYLSYHELRNLVGSLPHDIAFCKWAWNYSTQLVRWFANDGNFRSMFSHEDRQGTLKNLSKFGTFLGKTSERIRKGTNLWSRNIIAICITAFLTGHIICQLRVWVLYYCYMWISICHLCWKFLNISCNNFRRA